MRAVLAEGASPERVAALLELDLAEVRRLSKATGTETADPEADAGHSSAAADRSLSVVGGDDAARRAN